MQASWSSQMLRMWGYGDESISFGQVDSSRSVSYVTERLGLKSLRSPKMNLKDQGLKALMSCCSDLLFISS